MDRYIKFAFIKFKFSLDKTRRKQNNAVNRAIISFYVFYFNNKSKNLANK